MSDVKMCASQPLHPDTDAPFEERVVAVPEKPNLHLFLHARCLPVERVTLETTC